MSLKRVAIRKGDDVMLCFVPDGLPLTLPAFDDIVHERHKTSVIMRTYQHGFPLCLDTLFLSVDAPDGEHQIGLVKGATLAGSFKFEPLQQQQAQKPPSTVNLSLSQIETIVYSAFEETVNRMASEFDLDSATVRTFFKENLARLVEEPARSHYKRYDHASRG